MDPLTIIFSISSVGKAVYQVYNVLNNYVNDSKNVSQSVKDLNLEVNSLGRALNAIEAGISSPLIQSAEQHADQAEALEMWLSVHGSLVDCRTTIEQLDEALGDVRVEHSNFGKLLVRTIKFNMKDAEIGSVRARVRSHTTALQMALQMLNLRASYLAPGAVISNLGPKILSLTDMVAEIQAQMTEQAIIAAEAAKDVPGDTISSPGATAVAFSHNTEKLKQSVKRVLSSAWTVSSQSSWNGSVEDNLMEERARKRLLDWIPEPIIEEDQQKHLDTSSSPSVAHKFGNPASPNTVFTDEAAATELDSVADDSGSDWDFELEVAQTLLQRGTDLYSQHKYLESEIALRRGLKQAEDLPLKLKQGLDLGSAQLLMADCYQQLDQLDNAESCLLGIIQAQSTRRKAVVIRYRASHQLSTLYLRRNQLSQANAYCLRAVKGRLRLCGRKDPSYFESLALLSEICKADGRTADADGYLDMIPSDFTVPVSPALGILSKEPGEKERKVIVSATETHLMDSTLNEESVKKTLPVTITPSTDEEVPPATVPADPGIATKTEYNEPSMFHFPEGLNSNALPVTGFYGINQTEHKVDKEDKETSRPCELSSSKLSVCSGSTNSYFNEKELQLTSLPLSPTSLESGTPPGDRLPIPSTEQMPLPSPSQLGSPSSSLEAVKPSLRAFDKIDWQLLRELENECNTYKLRRGSTSYYSGPDLETCPVPTLSDIESLNLEDQEQRLTQFFKDGELAKHFGLLHIACAIGHTELVRHILDHSFKGSQTHGPGQPPWASSNSFLSSVMEISLSRLHAVWPGGTILQLSAGFARPATLSLLLEMIDLDRTINSSRKNIYMTLRDSQGFTLIHMAASRGRSHVPVLQALMQHHRNRIGTGYIPCPLVNTRDPKGRTPLHLAARYGTVQSTRLIMEMIAYPQGGAMNPERIGVTERHVRAFIDATETCLGWTALHYAAGSGNLEIVKLLVFSGANPTIVARGGTGSSGVHGVSGNQMTPRRAAKHAGHMETAKFLKKYNHSPSMPTFLKFFGDLTAGKIDYGAR